MPEHKLKPKYVLFKGQVSKIVLRTLSCFSKMKTQPTLADLLSPFPYQVSLSRSPQWYFSFVTEKNKKFLVKEDHSRVGAPQFQWGFFLNNIFPFFLLARESKKCFMDIQKERCSDSYYHSPIKQYWMKIRSWSILKIRKLWNKRHLIHWIGI